MYMQKLPSCKRVVVQLSATVALRSGSADWPINSTVGVRMLNNCSS